MSQEEQTTEEQRLYKQELKTITGKPQHIQIDALKTKQAYDKAFKDKGMQTSNKRDYPRSGQGYRQIQRLMQFDYIVRPDKGEIRKVINTLTVQPVTVDKQKKFAIYYNGSYVGYDAWGSEIQCTFNEGYHYKPKLQFVVHDISNPFDTKTGERKGSWQDVGYSYEHDIFIPEEPKARRKLLQKLTKDFDMSNCVYSYRVQNHDNNHQSVHGQISLNNLYDLTFDQLEELQTKGYFKDTNGSLFDKDGYTVRYNESGKIQAIK